MNALPTTSTNNFEQCIKCTVCTVYCPVSVMNPLFPGPKQAGPDGERFRLKNANFYDEALQYCTNCKRCEVACPSNVKIGDIIQAARIRHSKAHPKWRDYLLAQTDSIGRVATPLAPVVNKTLQLKPVKTLLDRVLQIDHRRSFPTYAAQTFESWYKQHQAAQDGYSQQVSFFHGCYVNYNQPQLGKDLVKVFNALGIGVQLLEKEKCCGVALVSNGFIAQAQKQARSNTAAIRQSVIQHSRPVVTTSSTCTMTLRDEYPQLLAVDNSDVREHIELATRYLYRLLSQNNRLAELPFGHKPLHVAYHTPCHLEKLGWAYYSIELLKQIPNIRLTVLSSKCCGIAGTYGFKKENYQTAQRIGAALFRQIEAGSYDCIVCDCETCKWQIEMSTAQTCLHPLSVVAQALAPNTTL